MKQKASWLSKIDIRELITLFGLSGMGYGIYIEFGLGWSCIVLGTIMAALGIFSFLMSNKGVKNDI